MSVEIAPNYPGKTPEYSSRAVIFRLVAGPLGALIVYFLLPDTYIDTQGQRVELSAVAHGAGAVASWMAIRPRLSAALLQRLNWKMSARALRWNFRQMQRRQA